MFGLGLEGEAMAGRRCSQLVGCRVAFSLGLLVLLPSATQAATPISFAGDLLSENFNTLPTSGTSKTTTQALADLDLTGWQIGRITGGNDLSLIANDGVGGSSTPGNLYSYGTTSSTDRALGSLASSGVIGRF